MRPAVHRFAREKALARGDYNLARSLEADLRRVGEPIEGPTAVAESANAEVLYPPPRKRGKEPKPRCEHGRLAERCLECNEDLEPTP